MKKISKKLISSVILSLIMYAPVNNVYAATLKDGPIFGENDIGKNDNYTSYRKENIDTFIYDFKENSSLIITTSGLGNDRQNALYIIGNKSNITINNKLDISLTNNDNGSLSGINILKNAQEKTIDRSKGGSITVNSINSVGIGNANGAKISNGENNSILLGNSDIKINVKNPNSGAEMYGLYIQNGQENKITMENGNIDITYIGDNSSDIGDNSSATASGVAVFGNNNNITTQDANINISVTSVGEQILINGLQAADGANINTGNGIIDINGSGKGNTPVYVNGIYTYNGNVIKEGGTIKATANGEGVLAARGVFADNGAKITILGIADVTTQAIGGSTENGNFIESIGLLGWNDGEINYAGGSITATADNNDAYVAAIHAKDDVVINVNQGTENKVVINGDVNNRGNGLINLTLNTESSAINGAIDDRSTKGINLTLADGAEWNNTGASNVKSVIMNQGIINQSIDEGITINNYSGTGDINFKAKNNTVDGVLDLTNIGNVTIENAGVGSVTNLSANADNTLNTIDSAKAYENLNAIANKIYYTNHLDGNITGSVKIAEGLITPEASGDLLFYEVDSNGHTAGQGYVANVKQNSSTTTIDNIKNIAATAIVAWRQEDSTLSQRLGELRESDGGQGIWVRMSRGEFEYDGEYKNQYNFFQMGYDWAAGSWHYGAAVSHNDGQTTYTHGDGENRSTSLSLYGTWLGDKGHYADIVLKQGRLSNDFDIYTEAGHTSGDYDAWGTSLSGEYGMKVDLDGGWYVTPQAQLTLMRIGGEDYTTNNGIKVNQDNLESAVGRVGFEVGKRISDSGSIYAKASLLHDFAGSADTYLSLNGLTNSYHQDIGDTWCEAGIGFNYKTSENSYVYADVVKTFGGDVETPWQWNAGMRWTF